jgi:hypothetical protein
MTLATIAGIGMTKFGKQAERIGRKRGPCRLLT